MAAIERVKNSFMFRVEQAITYVLEWPRELKRLMALALDCGLCLLSTWLAFYLRLGELVSLSGPGWPAAVLSPILAIPIFIRLGLYRAVFRYIGGKAFLAIANAVTIYGIAYFSVFTVFSIEGVPRTVGIIQPILLLLGVGGSRIVGRYWLSGRYRELLRSAGLNKVLIYGAGSAGRQLATAIDDAHDLHVVGFIDDDKGIQGRILSGKPVWGADALEALVDHNDISEVFVAIPSATKRRRLELSARLQALGVGVRLLPGIVDLARGTVTVSDLRPLDIEDLLGRDRVEPDQSLLQKNITGKTVLVTGAGGSIGSEICRQVLMLDPALLVLLDLSEFALYQIHYELVGLAKALNRSVEIVPIIGSVCDESRLRRVFEIHQPHTVYHAAAYKHVPLVEHNIVEGVRNNALGTWSCARAAAAANVSNFVLISTDKAVRPTNVMGASKRLAELCLQGLSETSSTCFSMVRFGNVLGSSGSVVPLFRNQIGHGGPVTVTHPEITRYFMTIPEASQLVIQAGSMAAGGEVFVLDMGQPVKVVDLARRMIELAGLRERSAQDPDGDIEIVFSGLRPGEKLYEELLIGDNPVPTDHPQIMMAQEGKLSLDDLNAALARIDGALERQDARAVRLYLSQAVREYTPENQIVDYLWCAQAPAGLSGI